MSSHMTQRSRAECLVTLKMSHQRSIWGQNLFQGILFGDDDSTVREHSMSAADLSNFKSALRTKMNDSLLKRINDVEGMDVLIYYFTGDAQLETFHKSKQFCCLLCMHTGFNFLSSSEFGGASHVTHMHVISILIQPNFSPKSMLTWIQIVRNGPKAKFRIVWCHVIIYFE